MGMKRIFYSMNTPKKIHTTIEHWQKWRKNFKMIHNENWTDFKFHCIILAWVDHEYLIKKQNPFAFQKQLNVFKK